MQTADNRVTIFPCNHDDLKCNNYLCDNSVGYKKWYIGPAHGAVSTMRFYCEPCMRHMVDHLPAEFSPEVAGIEHRLRAEITTEYDKVLTAKVNELETAIRTKVTSEVLEQITKSEKGKPAPVVVEEEVAVENQVPYRCLDCNEEFDTPQKLGAHRRTHQREPKVKK